MAQWRARMRRQGQEVTCWFKPHQLPTPVLVASDSCATITQTLNCIRAFWQTVWKGLELFGACLLNSAPLRLKTPNLNGYQKQCNFTRVLVLPLGRLLERQ